MLLMESYVFVNMKSTNIAKKLQQCSERTKYSVLQDGGTLKETYLGQILLKMKFLF